MANAQVGTDVINDKERKGTSLTVSVDELAVLNNAINEVCHGIHMDDAEFEIRMGVSRHEARALLDQIRQALHRAA